MKQGTLLISLVQEEMVEAVHTVKKEPELLWVVDKIMLHLATMA